MKKQKHFYRLYEKWISDTKFLSYHDRNNPIYIEIISLGKDIIPLLISNLWGSWLPLLALPEILGQTPFNILPEDMGKFDSLNEKWYKWGKSQNII